MNGRREDRLRAARLLPVAWARDPWPGEEVCEGVLARAGKAVLARAGKAVGDGRVQIYCLSFARAAVATMAVAEVGGECFWQPRGEDAVVGTSRATVLEVLLGRLRPHRGRYEGQPARCRGCGGLLPTGALVWEMADRALACGRCHETQRLGGVPRAYCRESDWGEEASEQARRRLCRATEQELELRARLGLGE